MLSPKPYISFSQIQLFEKDPDLYARKYIQGEEINDWNPRLDLGKRFAEAIEKGTDDEDLNLAIACLPKYPYYEYELCTEMSLKGDSISLLCKLDCFDKKKGILGEVKTGRNWTQKRADELRQLKFYHYAYWLDTHRMLKEVRLHAVETSDDSENPCFTGNVRTFHVKHRVSDLLAEGLKVEKAYLGIKNLMKEHLKTI